MANNIKQWVAWGLLGGTALALFACGGASSGSSSGSASSAAVAQPANTTGRLLASNCFQCHGTGGYGGFENIRGSEAEEVLDYLTKSGPSNIMAAHAQGYTRAQLLTIIQYLKQ